MIKDLGKYRFIFTLEEHFSQTGIKSIISSNLSDRDTKIISLNNKNQFISQLGSRNYVRKSLVYLAIIFLNL